MATTMRVKRKYPTTTAQRTTTVGGGLTPANINPGIGAMGFGPKVGGGLTPATNFKPKKYGMGFGNSLGTSAVNKPYKKKKKLYNY